MGRAPTPWLQTAFDMLASGEWVPRDQVLAAMSKRVPPGVAYRRGQKMDRGNNTSEELLMSRGARHICLTALGGRPQIKQMERNGVFLVRLAEAPPARTPLVLTPVEDEAEAEYVIVPVDMWHGRRHLQVDELRWVR